MKVETVIKTPQFIDNSIFDYTIQEGIIDTDTWEFEPLYLIKGRIDKHKVSFHNEKSYLKSKVKPLL